MKTTTFLAAAVGAILISVVPVAPVAAQGGSSAKGFFIGAHLNASSLGAGGYNDESQTGSGGGVHLGYGFTPRLAFFGEFTGAAFQQHVVDVGAFGHVDVGLRYAWTGPTRRWVPSLEMAYTGRGVAQSRALLEDGDPHDVVLTGKGVTFGAGMQFYATPKLALGAAFKWTRGEFDKFAVDDESVDDVKIDAASARVNLGITWYPFAGR